MKILETAKESKRNINSILLTFIAFTIPFLLNLGNVSIIFAVVFNVLFLKKNVYKKWLCFSVWFPWVFFVITVLSGYFSKNSEVGLKHLDLTLLLVLIPLVVSNNNISKPLIFKILRALYIGSTIWSLVLLVNATLKSLKNKSFENLIFHDFTEMYDQHPVYFSLYLSLALFFYYYIGKEKRKEILKSEILRILSNTILFIGLIMCASKAVLVLDIVAIISFYLKGVRSKNKQLIRLIMVVTLLALFFQTPFIKKRFQEGLRFSGNILSFKPTNDFGKKKQFSYQDKESISDLELRVIFGKIALYHSIEDGKTFFGYGQGDVQDYLDYYYFSYNLGPNWYENYNAHNQYIHIFITYGIFTLLFFLSYLGYSYYIALKNNDNIYLFFLIISSFVFFFEVMLVRNKGIIFFYFFNTLFLLSHLNFENSNTRNKRNTKSPWRI